MEYNIYHQFHDPSQLFLKEPRAFCYELSTQLIEKAKEISADNWYENEYTIKGLLLLLFTWNYAAKETKKLNFLNVGELLRATKKDLILLEKYSIITVDDTAWEVIKGIFNQFRNLIGQTGSSKALSLLNPELFVMWDTSIRKYLNRKLIPGIESGNKGEHYVIFLKGIKNIIKAYNISEKLSPDSVIAKKIDEFHYVTLVMNKRAKRRKVNENGTNKVLIKARQLDFKLPDNLRGRSIREKVIPTVCNLENMLLKLKELDGESYKLKQWENRSYQAYLIEKIKPQILTYHINECKEILRNHILRSDPLDLGASCIDIYLVAHVSETFGGGKDRFIQYIIENDISQKYNSANAIWQVGKTDGVFLEILNDDGTIKDVEFFKKWISG